MNFIFSISRTIKDKNANTGRLFLAKNRNGPDGMVFPIFMDTSNVKIKVLAQNGETYDSLKAKETRNLHDNLKEKYKKHRREGE